MRRVEVTAKALSRPEATKELAAVRVTKATGIWLPRRSLIAGPAPLYPMCVCLYLACLAKPSPISCACVPWPDEPQLMPSLAFCA